MPHCDSEQTATPQQPVAASDHNFPWDHSVVTAELYSNVPHEFPSSWFLLVTTAGTTHKFSLALVLHAESPVAECLGRHISMDSFPYHARAQMLAEYADMTPHRLICHRHPSPKWQACEAWEWEGLPMASLSHNVWCDNSLNQSCPYSSVSPISSHQEHISLIPCYNWQSLYPIFLFKFVFGFFYWLDFD